ncbi:MFS transporter [Derxia gummosa]|uniref:MFS transporter n=1 Tax=Derxia gummosa DSM 723 TaxID=1121388 RepID=A0A8B6XA30_9BURK|nr:MFS transporter [Derxia gummosa]
MHSPTLASAASAHAPAALARKPGIVQALLLLVTSSLSVLVTAILGPSLPAMQAEYASVPGADFLVPLTMTAPLLMMAGLCVLAGELADRVGRKRLLVGAALLYAGVGTMPLWLGSLHAIIVSRFCLGLLEAVLFTVSTVMIGDYFDGARRERLMSLQTTVSATSAFLFNGLGGVIAEHGWRAPYAVFGVSLLLAPLMALCLWEPPGRAGMSSEQVRADSRGFRPVLLAFNCLLAGALGIMFLTVPVHFGFLHEAIGVKSPARIGLAYALNSLGVVSGTLLFGWVLAPRLTVAAQLALGCVIAGAGFVLMRQAHDFGLLACAGLLNGLGAGMLLPSLVTWNMRMLPLSRRGLGTGAFQSAFSFGMFVNPLLVVGLEHGLAVTRAEVIGLIGVAMLALAALASTQGLRAPKAA